MKTSTLYRVPAVLMVLWAVGHTFGFRQRDPEWGVDTLLAAMRSIHFDCQGFSRTYWDFYVGFGLFVTVFLLFAALCAWQLSSLRAETLARIRGIAWALPLCFIALAILSWGYLFTIAIVFSIVIAACLIAAAWLAGRPRSR